MASAGTKQDGKLDGPPASNLRKTGRSLSAESNMVAVSDKQVTQASKRINVKAKCSKTEERSASVMKGWLTKAQELGTVEASGSESVYDTENENEEEQEWGAGQQEPIEEWNDEYEMPSQGFPLQQGKFVENEAQNGISGSNDILESSDQEHDEEEEEEDYKSIIDENIKKGNLQHMLEEMYSIMRQIRRQLKQESRKNSKQGRLVEGLQNRLDYVSKVAIKNDVDMCKMQEKIVRIEQKAMKAEIIVTGIKEQEHEKCEEVAKSFMKDQLQISETISFEDVRRLGRSGRENRPLLITLTKLSDKAVIYKHAKNLKGKQNEDGAYYFINDNLPEVLEERKRVRKAKVKVNKSLVVAQQQNLTWKKGELLVDGEEYVPKVAEPKPAEMLGMSDTQIKQILSYRVFQGQTKDRNGSVFTGYAAKVHSIADVVTAYQQMKYRFADATHVICAYKIMDPDIAHMHDCVDGSEIGAGRRILEMMIENNYNNIAVFVVRYHNGPNLGAVRFDIIKEVAKKAIQGMPQDLEGLMSRAANNFSYLQQPLPRQSSAYPRLQHSRVRGGSSMARQPSYTVKITDPRAKKVIQNVQV